jgi:hypothetical protein
MVQDPVVEVLKYAFAVDRDYYLEDFEAALNAAAFVLYGPSDYLQLATEAAYYHANTSGNFIDALVEAYKRRMSNGTLGSRQTTVEHRDAEV